MSETEWTLGRLLEWTTQYLRDKGAEFPRLDAEVLLAHVAGCRRIDLYTRFQEVASERVRGDYRHLVRRRVEGCPVAYLVGHKEFFSLDLQVTPDVLIPRPETEILVLELLQLARPMTNPTFVDVGTGSGAIAIAALKNHTGMRGLAIDCCAKALAVAARNADSHGVSSRLTFLQSDLFQGVSDVNRFDFIVSNPPYVASDAWAELPVGVRDYEPRLALVGGSSGYEVIGRLIEQSRYHLHSRGYLLVETGATQAETVVALIKRFPEYEEPAIVHDHAGLPRVVRARRAES
jgi:release factor glutamine methyltransferase